MLRVVLMYKKWCKKAKSYECVCSHWGWPQQATQTLNSKWGLVGRRLWGTFALTKDRKCPLHLWPPSKIWTTKYGPALSWSRIRLQQSSAFRTLSDIFSPWGWESEGPKGDTVGSCCRGELAGPRPFFLAHHSLIPSSVPLWNKVPTVKQFQIYGKIEEVVQRVPIYPAPSFHITWHFTLVWYICHNEPELIHN